MSVASLDPGPERSSSVCTRSKTSFIATFQANAYAGRYKLTWGCCGIEACPTIGEPHAQLAFELDKKCTLASAKAFFFNDTHLEPSGGTARKRTGPE